MKRSGAVWAMAGLWLAVSILPAQAHDGREGYREGRRGGNFVPGLVIGGTLGLLGALATGPRPYGPPPVYAAPPIYVSPPMYAPPPVYIPPQPGYYVQQPGYYAGPPVPIPECGYGNSRDINGRQLYYSVPPAWNPCR